MAEAAITLSQALDRAMAGEPILPSAKSDGSTHKATQRPTPIPRSAVCAAKGRDQIIAGPMVHFTTSEWFHICAEHAAQMSKPGMGIWEWECGAADRPLRRRPQRACKWPSSLQALTSNHDRNKDG